MKERLLRAYSEEGALLGDPATLVRLAVEAGLGEAEAADVLAGDTYAREVRADEAEAHEIGITGVPCFVLGSPELERRFAVTGAQSPEILLSALHHAWSGGREGAELSEGAACGPDGC